MTTFQPGQPSAASWYMVALVRNETSITLYSNPGALADNAVVSTGTSPNNVLFSADTNLILGRDASDVATAYSFFTGVFSFVGLFNTALDAGQIFALWNGRNAYVTNVPFPPPPPSPEQPVGFPPIPDPPLYDPPSTTTTTDLTDYWWCVARSGSQLACACSPARSPFRRLWQERRRESSHLPAAMV